MTPWPEFVKHLARRGYRIAHTGGKHPWDYMVIDIGLGEQVAVDKVKAMSNVAAAVGMLSDSVPQVIVEHTHGRFVYLRAGSNPVNDVSTVGWQSRIDPSERWVLDREVWDALRRHGF